MEERVKAYYWKVKSEKNLKTVSYEFTMNRSKRVSPQTFKTMVFADMKRVFLDVGYVKVCNDHNLLEANDIDEEFVVHRLTLVQEKWTIQDDKEEKMSRECYDSDEYSNESYDVASNYRKYIFLSQLFVTFYFLIFLTYDMS